ncbi:hypothetical protein V6N13_040263 [Hibiscus sabdariffa]|uniref:Uncharacterized protein n=1 Tax=Hibiscus sabdariffa TaxID=183260 RepID=A0ABR2C6X8_9ROSI
MRSGLHAPEQVRLVRHPFMPFSCAVAGLLGPMRMGLVSWLPTANWQLGAMLVVSALRAFSCPQVFILLGAEAFSLCFGFLACAPQRESLFVLRVVLTLWPGPYSGRSVIRGLLPIPLLASCSCPKLRWLLPWVVTSGASAPCSRFAFFVRVPFCGCSVAPCVVLASWTGSAGGCSLHASPFG